MPGRDQGAVAVLAAEAERGGRLGARAADLALRRMRGQPGVTDQAQCCLWLASRSGSSMEIPARLADSHHGDGAVRGLAGQALAGQALAGQAFGG